MGLQERPPAVTFQGMNDEERHQARRVLEHLLRHPPLNPEDQSSRLGNLVPAALRRALLERLDQGGIGPAEEDVARSLFATLGVGVRRPGRGVEPASGSTTPRSDQLVRLVFTVGTTFADVLLGLEEQGSGWADRRMEQTAQTFSELLQVDPSQVRPLNDVMVERLTEFLTDTCGRCPVQCVDRPQQDVTAVYFASRHPAQHWLT